MVLLEETEHLRVGLLEALVRLRERGRLGLLRLGVAVQLVEALLRAPAQRLFLGRRQLEIVRLLPF